MRHGRVVAIAAVALVGLTGCADRPNDLETYYDDPPGSTTPNPPRSTSTHVGQGPAPQAENTLARDVTSATLVGADVAVEGVHPATPPAKAPACLAAAQQPPAARRDASWQYPSGSSLNQLVTGYRIGRPPR